MSSRSEINEYIIVDFPDESKDGTISMALISSAWLFEENGLMYCYWPTYIKSTLSREKAVKNHTPLNIERCTKCRVIVKQHDVDYTMATAKLKRLEEESEQSSSNTDGELSLRFNKPHRNSDFIYSYEEDSDEENIPLPPKFPGGRSTGTPRPTVQTVKPKPLSQHGHSFPNVSQHSSNLVSLNNLDETLTQSQSHSIYQVKECAPQANTAHGSSESDANDASMQKCQCEKSLKIMERALRDLQIIKMDVKNLLQMTNNEKYMEFQTLDKLSFTKYEEIQDFNNKLGEQDFFNKMQASICLLGGRDLQDTTRKIISLLISHELALKINWIGANEKGSFQKLDKVLKVIYGAVRRNPICANATNSEIDQSIRNWIKNAPDREGGSANRKKK